MSKKVRHGVLAGWIAALSITTALAQEATPAPPGCTAGSSGIGDPYFPLMGNSGYDVLHCR